MERFANESLDREHEVRFSHELHLKLQSCTSKEAFRLVVFRGGVLVFHSRTPGTQEKFEQLPGKRLDAN